MQVHLPAHLKLCRATYLHTHLSAILLKTKWRTRMDKIGYFLGFYQKYDLVKISRCEALLRMVARLVYAYFEIVFERVAVVSLRLRPSM